MAECSAGSPGSLAGTKSPLYAHACSNPAQDMLPDVQAVWTTGLRAYAHVCMHECEYVCTYVSAPPPSRPPLVVVR